MAKGTTHIFFALLISLIILYVLAGKMSYRSSVLLLVCAVAGSVFPDIDTRSKGRTLMYYLMIPAYTIMIYYRQLLLCLLIAFIAFLPLFVVHRGIFHRLWFIALCIGVFALSLANIFPHYAHSIYSGALFFSMGVLSHLWLDFGF